MKQKHDIKTLLRWEVGLVELAKEGKIALIRSPIPVPQTQSHLNEMSEGLNFMVQKLQAYTPSVYKRMNLLLFGEPNEVFFDHVFCK